MNLILILKHILLEIVKQKLLDFYKKYEDRIILMPAAHKKEYHSAFPGGYVDHVNRVVKQL